MTVQQTYTIFQGKQKLFLALTICLITGFIANVVLDYLTASVQNSSFYISESLLFSTYWMLYPPILWLLSKPATRAGGTGPKLIILLIAIAVHVLAYPALVWLVSKTFYTHTFAYGQTFHFGLSAYFIKTALIYGFLLVLFTLLNKKVQAPSMSREAEVKATSKAFIHSILIADNNNKKLLLQVNDIFYISANSPYISIYHISQKYLHTATLRSLEQQLNDQQFVRIHKSCIVNLDKVSSIASRQNGDYDLTLSDNTILRVSRNYARQFKSTFSVRHQLTAK